MYVCIILLLFAVFTAGFYAYPLLPDTVVSHWNVSGEPDGVMSRFWGIFLIPMIFIALAVAFAVLPKIDPLKKNIAEFRPSYNLLIMAILVFLGYVYALLLLWNLGQEFDVATFMLPGIGALFLIIGYLLPETKRNWFLGIRTPWTLSSDFVWKETHRVGGRLFMAAGAVIITVGLLLPTKVFAVLMAVVLVSVAWTVVFSYVLFRRESSAKS